MASPAQPFINWRDRLVRLADRMANYDTDHAAPAKDSPWHDDMVRRANASFRNAARAKAKTASGAASPSASSTAPKKATKRASRSRARKRG